MPCTLVPLQWHLLWQSIITSFGARQNGHRNQSTTKLFWYGHCMDNFALHDSNISSGSGRYVTIILNLEHIVFFFIFLPAITTSQKNTIYGIPYDEVPKTKGSEYLKQQVDLFRHFLHGQKSSFPLYKLFLVFCLALSSVQIWLDYGLYVLYSSLYSDDVDGFVVKCLTPEKMEASLLLIQRAESLIIFLSDFLHM